MTAIEQLGNLFPRPIALPRVLLRCDQRRILLGCPVLALRGLDLLAVAGVLRCSRFRFDRGGGVARLEAQLRGGRSCGRDLDWRRVGNDRAGRVGRIGENGGEAVEDV